MSDDLRPPQPPTPTRLNRRVLLVAAATLGLTLLATAYTLTHSGPARRTAALSPAPVPTPDRPAEPGFLARPPSSATIDEERLRELLAAQQPPAPPVDELPPPEGLEQLDTPAVPPTPPFPARDERREALARALLSPLQPPASRPSGLPAQGSAFPGTRLSAPDAQEPLLSPASGEAGLRDLLALSPIAPGAPTALGAPPAPTTPTAPADPHERFLVEATRGRPRELAAAYERPGSPFRLQAGTVLPAALLTAVRSDLPGGVVAQLTRDVYDRTQTFLLLPRGARLLGRYDSQLSPGQDRLLVAWDRILLPDGSSLRLPGLASAAPGGEAGLAGRVDAHYGRLFGGALLLSLISAGVQLSQPQQSATAGQAPSSGQVAAGALGQQLGELGVEITRRNLDVRPTVTLPAGLEFHVQLTGDLVLPGPYPA